MVKKNNDIDNKYEFGIAFLDKLVKHWFKIMSLIIIAAIAVFVFQLKSFQCGDAKMEKQTFSESVKSVKGDKHAE